jgi:hypothetical protein
MNIPWNLGFELGFSGTILVVMMHLLPGFVSITFYK